MTDPVALPPESWSPPVVPPPVPADWVPTASSDGFRRDLRAGAVIVGVLVVAGAVLGLIWQWWSPVQPGGYVVAPHSVEPLTEAEEWVAADGRFAVIAASVGLVAAVLVWFVRSVRGPVAALALSVGGLLGALATDGIGRLIRGGQSDGRTGAVLKHLPLQVHMHGLLVVEATVATLAYGVIASFAAEDDLGRSDPPPTRTRGSVGPQVQLDDSGRDRDGAGLAQQWDLPPH